MRSIKMILLLICLLDGVFMFAYAADSQQFWPALESGGHIVLLRHALAPGTGDPPGFDVADCATQRNLSERGREQARRIRTLFRSNGIDSARVYSSQWCRCLETARLLELGPVTELPILNSFFQVYHRRDKQTRQLTEWLARQDLSVPLVLVTHQVNITALTGVFPGSGELVLLRYDKSAEFTVVGTLTTD